ncbi:hypothetical protein [Diaphorobacter limosus]|uniref:Uncharacterized protein n=1 Tax=Diaphorobacter limosus TaxID=3036128 RepID=A0ABZ0J4R7_9BURK|nr:hypothetical protein [Diaphorobacter sp. Y-1]WOO31848.1 hypothetical protein P4826_15820 [Diaphorobacter sp. Y-1]
MDKVRRTPWRRVKSNTLRTRSLIDPSIKTSKKLTGCTPEEHRRPLRARHAVHVKPKPRKT